MFSFMRTYFLMVLLAAIKLDGLGLLLGITLFAGAFQLAFPGVYPSI